ncbi:MAG: type II secretion system protein GspM [Stellaceae bacterium]
MTLKLSPPLSRTLALAILLCLCAVLYLGVAQPLIDNYAAARGSVTELQDLLERYRRAARDLGPRQEELAALKQRRSAEDGFLQGTNDTLLAVQIQNRVKSLANASHSELRSSQVLPPQEEGKLRRISVRGQVSTTLAGAQRLFYGLESATPLLFIDNVDMRARPADPRDRGNAEVSDIIDLQFDVSGYAQGGK